MCSTTKQTMPAATNPCHQHHEDEDYFDYDEEEDYLDYDDFHVAAGDSKGVGVGRSILGRKKIKRQNLRGGSNTSGNIYSSKHVRAKESLQMTTSKGTKAKR